MSLINSLGKHPASNTSCLDGEAVAPLAAPSPASPRPDSPRSLGQGRGMPGCGCVWAELGGYIPRGAALLQLALGLCCVLGGEEVLCPGCVSLGTAHTTAVCIPTESQALPCWRTAFHLSCFTGAVFGSNRSCWVGGGQC